MKLAQTVAGALVEETHAADEKYFGTAAALHGSDAAYVFQLIDTLVDTGGRIGLPGEMARELLMRNTVGFSRTA